MCGIFGFCRIGGGAPADLNAGLLRSATYHLSHRGPDARGLAGWTMNGDLKRDDDLTDQPLQAALGHCRLAILDLTQAGRQPMSGPDGNWLVFNGEIYNHHELRTDLASRGFQFKTRTDTEVIMAAYSAWGEDCVRHFNGMWAFALFDPKKKSLFVSRDRLGVKPFYYVLTENYFLFSSEIRPFFYHSEIRPLIDKKRLIHYLIDYKIDNGPDTIYADVKELRGGHNLFLNTHTGQHCIKRFWELPDGPDIELSDEGALDRYSELIEDAVRLRLHADVPVAVTLSGGIDSSVISVAASRVHNAPLQTFTSSFPDNREIDETRYAAAVAEACGIKPAFIEPSVSRMIEEEPLLTLHQEMPYRSLSLYIHWVILSRIRSEGFPVVLSGQGGDELFGGYERYHVSALAAQYPNIIKMVSDFFRASANSQIGVGRLMAYIAYFSSPRLQRYMRLRKSTAIYHPDLLSLLPPPAKELPGTMRDLQTSEILSNNLPALLRYDDRTSGALGVETRLPFLDYRMVEFAFRLPLRHKIRDGWTKHLSRRYLARHVPGFVAWRRNKLGFDAPQRHWSLALLERNGGRLRSGRFADGLLSRGLQLQDIPMRHAWDVYNTLQLADLLNWSWSEDQ